MVGVRSAAFGVDGGTPIGSRHAVSDLEGTMEQTLDRTEAEADTSAEVDAELVEEELLVEEISIDGMCGVY